MIHYVLMVQDFIQTHPSFDLYIWSS